MRGEPPSRHALERSGFTQDQGGWLTPSSRPPVVGSASWASSWAQTLDEGVDLDGTLLGRRRRSVRRR
jgi:hypothetical protein